MHQYVEDGEELHLFYTMYESLPPGHMDLATRWNDLSQTLLYRCNDLYMHVCSILYTHLMLLNTKLNDATTIYSCTLIISNTSRTKCDRYRCVYTTTLHPHTVDIGLATEQLSNLTFLSSALLCDCVTSIHVLSMLYV